MELRRVPERDGGRETDREESQYEEGVPVLPVYLFAMRRAGTTPHNGGKALSVVVHGGRGRDRRRRWRLPLDSAERDADIDRDRETEPEPAGSYHYDAMRNQGRDRETERDRERMTPPPGKKPTAGFGAFSPPGRDRESRERKRENVGLGSRRNAIGALPPALLPSCPLLPPLPGISLTLCFVLGLLEWLENSFVELSKTEREAQKEAERERERQRQRQQRQQQQQQQQRVAVHQLELQRATEREAQREEPVPTTSEQQQRQRETGRAREKAQQESNGQHNTAGSK